MKALLRASLAALLSVVAACSGERDAQDDVATGGDLGSDEVRSCGTVDGPSDGTAAKKLWAEVPRAWQTALVDERNKDYFPRLASFVASARAGDKAVYPPEDETFTALSLAAPDAVQVVVLGQDPYIQEGQAHGLAFSVKPPTVPPPSLRNIFQELHDDLPAIRPVSHGSLVAWAKQGVLLLNAVLTVEEGRPGSHACRGWESFTDAIIRKLSERPDPIVFVLWGSFAQSKIPLIDARHVIIEGAHPSPLSARRGFFGSRPFSQVNAALAKQDKRPIDWQLPETTP